MVANTCQAQPSQSLVSKELIYDIANQCYSSANCSGQNQSILTREVNHTGSVNSVIQTGHVFITFPKHVNGIPPTETIAIYHRKNEAKNLHVSEF